MFVNKRMTHTPVTVSPNAMVADASEIMRNNKFRRLPVVDNGQLVGIVTDRDLREVSASPATSLSIFELNYLLAKMKVKDVMRKNVVTIRSDATIEEAALLMYNHKIGGLVVVDEKDAVVGIITETDIFKCFVDVMGLPEGTTRVTLDVKDNVGVLYDVAGVFKDLKVNITSLASYPLEDGKKELVIRTDASDTQALEAKLAERGYPVQHIVHIQ